MDNLLSPPIRQYLLSHLIPTDGISIFRGRCDRGGVFRPNFKEFSHFSQFPQLQSCPRILYQLQEIVAFLRVESRFFPPFLDSCILSVIKKQGIPPRDREVINNLSFLIGSLSFARVESRKNSCILYAKRVDTGRDRGYSALTGWALALLEF